MFKNRLQYKITVFIFVILLVIGIIGAVFMLQLQRRTAISQFEESGLTLARALHNSLEHDMLEAKREHIQDAVTRIATGVLINEVVILSNTQKVYASGECSEVGVTRDDEEIARALATGEVVSRTEKRYGQNEFCVIFPVMNKSECYTCHRSKSEVLGIIEIGLDRAPLDDQIRDQTMIMLLIGGLTFISVGGTLALILRSSVVNPLLKLIASARRIAGGNLSDRVEIQRDDEVGMMARSFNEMAEQIEQHSKTLEVSKRELEEVVLERTEELQKTVGIRGELLERLISAQEEERHRIARELHDETGQALSAIMMDLARSIDNLPGEATEAKQGLLKSRSLAAQTLTELRKLIYNLRPEVLDQLGLAPALRSYVKSRLDGKDIKVKLSFSGLDDRLPSRTEITLFRIIQEATTNIVRHSDASRVHIKVAATDTQVTAAIEDNGRGFDVEEGLKAAESWGLRGIRERIDVVGGELSINSTPGQGTRIRFQIPLEDN
ncbi:histidine kinase [Chloroflexota bacterium]